MLFVGCYSIFPFASATERWEAGKKRWWGEKRLWGEESKEIDGREEKDGKWERRGSRGRKKETVGEESGKEKWEVRDK